MDVTGKSFFPVHYSKRIPHFIGEVTVDCPYLPLKKQSRWVPNRGLFGHFPQQGIEKEKRASSREEEAPQEPPNLVTNSTHTHTLVHSKYFTTHLPSLKTHTQQHQQPNFTIAHRKIMGSEKKRLDHDHDHGHDYNTPPKLSLPVTRPCLAPEAPTPPPRTTALSVPFQWEEAPGKPRPCHTRSEPSPRGTGRDAVVARALELPPRLLSSLDQTNNNNSVPSPTTVLDGPYVGRAVSFTSSYRGSSIKDTESLNFASSRWVGLKKNSNNHNNRVDPEGSFDFSSWTVDGTSKVKITRVRRKGSFLSRSHGNSHLWVCCSLPYLIKCLVTLLQLLYVFV